MPGIFSQEYKDRLEQQTRPAAPATGRAPRQRQSAHDGSRHQVPQAPSQADVFFSAAEPPAATRPQSPYPVSMMFGSIEVRLTPRPRSESESSTERSRYSLRAPNPYLRNPWRFHPERVHSPSAIPLAPQPLLLPPPSLELRPMPAAVAPANPSEERHAEHTRELMPVASEPNRPFAVITQQTQRDGWIGSASAALR